MRNRMHAVVVGVLALATISWSQLVGAEEGRDTDHAIVSTGSPQAAAATDAGAAAVPPLANPLGGVALDGAALADERGGADVASVVKLNGVVTDNKVADVTTGGNFITDGAFSGAAGMPMVIQNSGNNVLIQNATIVNVQLK